MVPFDERKRVEEDGVAGEQRSEGRRCKRRSQEDESFACLSMRC